MKKQNDIRNGLFNLDSKLDIFFKRPFMRKNKEKEKIKEEKKDENQKKKKKF